MRHALQVWFAITALAIVPASARAGWVSQWTNTPMRSNGERVTPEASSMEIANNRVRLSQPQIVTVIDYNTGKFILMNPVKEYYWSGTIDEYVREMTRQRKRSMANQGFKLKPDKGEEEAAAPAKPAPIDTTKLPPIAITDTGIKEKIAGYDTTKYEIRADGELFQEIWVAPIDVSSDLNLERFLAEQRKISAVMMGKIAAPYNALYHDPQYLQLLQKAQALKIVTRHLAGGFERVATSFQPADIPASQFEVPDSYRRVRLNDVLPAAPQPTPQANKGT